MYDIKSFYEAKNVEDAVEALQKDENAIIISGGTDVLVKVREGKDAGKSLVSIHEIEDLKGVEIDNDGTIFIKSATVFYDITNNDIIKKHIDFLGDACDEVGGPQIRNMGTIGGNICNGATSADSASSMQVLNAKAILKGPNGTREVNVVKDFYIGPGRTVKDRSEVCLGFKIEKKEYEGFKGSYLKYGKRKSMEIATLGCAVMLKLEDDNKTISDFKIAYAVAAPTPIRCPQTEQFAKGQDVTNEIFLKELANKAFSECNPRSSWRASKEFREQIIKELAKRATTKAYEKCVGKYKKEVSVTC
ncbi:MAG: xanthine dehydrogenase FAD-binding subunit XdhB [Eubacteriales bacterium]|nr:xanthine dehydrogenase FAD-binding subunit XdhB [Eubacteriales bacterium]